MHDYRRTTYTTAPDLISVHPSTAPVPGSPCQNSDLPQSRTPCTISHRAPVQSMSGPSSCYGLAMGRSWLGSQVSCGAEMGVPEIVTLTPPAAAPTERGVALTKPDPRPTEGAAGNGEAYVVCSASVPRL